jgi:hypothetical protein
MLGICLSQTCQACLHDATQKNHSLFRPLSNHSFGIW